MKATRDTRHQHARHLIARLAFIRRELVAATESRTRRVNMRTLSRDYEVSEKTITRDLKFLRDELGWEIEYDEPAYTFYFKRLPPVAL